MVVHCTVRSEVGKQQVWYLIIRLGCLLPSHCGKGVGTLLNYLVTTALNWLDIRSVILVDHLTISCALRLRYISGSWSHEFCTIPRLSASYLWSTLVYYYNTFSTVWILAVIGVIDDGLYHLALRKGGLFTVIPFYTQQRSHGGRM